MKFRNFKVSFELKNGAVYKEISPANADFIESIKKMLRDGEDGYIQCQTKNNEAAIFPVNQLATMHIQGLKET